MLIALIASVLLPIGHAAVFASGACTPDLHVVGACVEVLNAGDHVDIGGDWSDPATGDETRPNADSSSPTEAPNASGAPADPCPLNRCTITYDVVGLPDVTLADLASFTPARPSIESEPAGIGITGMPINLLATASTHTIPGRLFDRDVTVRFTPAGYEFDHGDGTTSTTPTGGQSWETLEQGQFTPTPTSHAYAERGRYTVTATALYTADVDFGTGWRPVPGYIRAPAGDYTIRIVEIHTALVDKTCTEDPHGPGC